MAKAKKFQIEVRVLQNGSPVAATVRPLAKPHTIELTSRPSGELAIPFYPLPHNVTILDIHKKGTTLVLNEPWVGLVSTGGETIRIDRRERRERTYPLKPGDYASLLLEDLRIMIKIGPVRRAKKVARRSGYGGSVFSLLFHDRYEKIAMFVALLLALMLILPAGFGLYYFRVKRPSHFEELADAYTLPFINDENLATAPEALQSQLNRSQYIASVVRYYRNVTQMIMGWPVEQERYLFPSSRALYEDLYEEYRAEISKQIDEQEEIDQASFQQPYTGLLALPSVYGESFQHRLVRMINKIDHLHASFRLSLDYRRKTTQVFAKDPPYNWSNYLKQNKSTGAAAGAEVEELSKINVFSQKTDEEAMYFEANQMAAKALKLQASLSQKASRQEMLSLDSVRPIYISPGVAYASFLHHNDFKPSHERIAMIRASEFGKTPKRKIKEPLIGAIDPKAISQVVYKHRFELNLCYDLALRRNQSLEGQMNWSWRIDSRGKISDISLVKTTLRDRQMINCVRRKLASWTFPRPKRGSVKVFHTFKFKPRNG